jgi:hypothetical protein
MHTVSLELQQQICLSCINCCANGVEQQGTVARKPSIGSLVLFHVLVVLCQHCIIIVDSNRCLMAVDAGGHRALSTMNTAHVLVGCTYGAERPAAALTWALVRRHCNLQPPRNPVWNPSDSTTTSRDSTHSVSPACFSSCSSRPAVCCFGSLPHSIFFSLQHNLRLSHK